MPNGGATHQAGADWDAVLGQADRRQQGIKITGAGEAIAAVDFSAGQIGGFYCHARLVQNIELATPAAADHLTICRQLPGGERQSVSIGSNVA